MTDAKPLAPASRLLTRAACLAMIGLLAACSTPYQEPRFASTSGDTRFQGIVQQLSDRGQLDLLLVHGMCTKTADWAAGTVGQIHSAVGGTEAIRLEPVEVGDTGVQLHRQEFATRWGPLRVSAIVWSPLTTPLKQNLCYDQTQKSPICQAADVPAYPYARARLNRVLKDTILDDCLADAVIYQGSARDEINARMQEAVLEAVAPPRLRAASSSAAAAAAAVDVQVPLVVVSESLGSKIAFDALLKLTESTDPQRVAAAERTFDRTTQIFMAANQVPILALADRGLDGRQKRLQANEAAYAEDPLAELIRRRQARSTAKALAAPTPPLRVVAFTDPNDILSYILVPSPWARSYDVVDVVVSNDTTWLGLFELPTTAHTGYLANREVRRRIACGNPISPDCPR